MASAVEPKSFELVDGDRVALVGNTFIDRMDQNGYLETLLTVRFHKARLIFRNLGWPGDTVYQRERPLNFGDLKEHLAAVRPTVIFVSYGTMESLDGPAKLPNFVAKYKELLGQLASSTARIVVIGSSQHEYLGPRLPSPGERNQNVALYNEAIGRLAGELGHRYVSLDGLISRTIAPRKLEAQYYGLTTNGIHLRAASYLKAGKMIESDLGLDTASWSCKVRLPERRIAMGGGKADQLAITPGTIQFRITDDVLPSPQPPREQRSVAHELSSLAAHRSLTVSGAEPGRYELLIDGKQIAANSVKEGARQLLLYWHTAPEFDDAEQLRQAILHKNQLWFFRYRPHNGEYVYGRRSKSFEHNSGNEQFPAEMQQLDRRIAEAEAEIHKLAQPVPHLYEIRSIGAEEK